MVLGRHPGPGASSPIYEKVAARARLSREDGSTLFESPDLLGVGRLAQMVKERLHGHKAYYIYNQHINYSNICVNGCKFCAFGRKAGDPGAYEMSLPEIFEKVEEKATSPSPKFTSWAAATRTCLLPIIWTCSGASRPGGRRIHLQAFTAVEVAHLAQKSRPEPARYPGGPERAGLGSLPRRRRRSLQSPGARVSARKSSRPRAGWRWLDGPRPRPQHQCHHALWSPGERGGAGGSSGKTARGPG